MTDGIRVKVGADLSGLKNDVNQAVNDIGKTAGAAAGTAGAQAGAKAAKQMQDGLDASTKAAAKLARELERIKRLQEAAAKAGRTISDTQARSLDADYNHLREHHQSASTRRKLQSVSLDSILAGTAQLGSNDAASRRMRNDVLAHLGVAGSPGNNQNNQRTFAQYIAQAVRRGAGGVAGAALPGGLGSTMMQTAGEGASIGGLAGLGRFAGGMGVAGLAFAAVKSITAIKGAIDSAEQESISYSDMLRRMGGTSVGFDGLRTSVRGAGASLGMNYGDSAKLAGSYIGSAGIDGMSGTQLRNELETAGGFARNLGLDPEAGAGVMGTLRHNKVSSGDSDNRRFAMMIGEAVARAGVFTKADEVLESVSSYTKEATRASLGAANTSGYIGALSNLMNLRQAGLDPSGAAGLLGSIDNSMRHGRGEAQRNQMLGALQGSIPGLTSVDMGFMQDAGMFARAKDVFGENSVAYGAADSSTQARYRKMAGAGGDKTFFDLVMGQMKGMGSDEQRKNMMGMFGLNDSSAAALQQAVQLHGGSLSSTMMSAASMYDLDPSKMSMGAMRNMLDVQYGDPSQLKSKAQWLRTQNLTTGEQGALDAAEKSPGADNEALKRTLVQLGVKYGNEETGGDVSRQNLAKMSNLASDVATKLIPMTNAIREAVVSVATTLTMGGFKDKFGNSDKAGTKLDAMLAGASPEQRANIIGAERARVNGDSDAYTTEYKDRVEGMFQSTHAAKANGDGGGADRTGAGDGLIGRAVNGLSRLTKSRAKMVAEPSAYDDMFKKAGKQFGVEWQDLKQIAVQESELHDYATHLNKDGSVDQGLMQLNSKYNKGRGLDAKSAMDPEANIMSGAGAWADALRAAKGDRRKAFAIYNGGYNPGGQAMQYADNAMALHDQWAGTPMPAGTKTAQGSGGAVNVNVNGNFTLQDQQGKPLAAPAQVSAVSAPRAAGVR